MYQVIDLKNQNILMLHRNKSILERIYQWKLADREVKLCEYKRSKAL